MNTIHERDGIVRSYWSRYAALLLQRAEVARQLGGVCGRIEEARSLLRTTPGQAGCLAHRGSGRAAAHRRHARGTAIESITRLHLQLIQQRLDLERAISAAEAEILLLASHPGMSQMGANCG